MIRLFIAAPSPVVRAGLETLAASSAGVVVVGSEADMNSAEALRPDVVLAQLAVEDLVAAPAIVLLAASAQAAWTADAVRLGVRAVLPPEATPAAILAALESAASGLAVVDPLELEEWLSLAPRPHAATVQPLTPRELEVLRMMADGAANKTIAWKLDISEHTVKFHVASILGKLNSNSRTEAVTRGIREGLILI